MRVNNPVLGNHEGGGGEQAYVWASKNPGAWFSMYLMYMSERGGRGREEGRDEPDKNLLGFGNEENMWSRVVSREYVNTEHPKEGVRYTLSPHLGKEKKNRIIPIFLTFHAWKVHIYKIVLRSKR